MKTSGKWIQWGAMAAASLSAIACPVQAGETSRNVEKASQLIGTEVRNRSDQKVGKIEDFVVDLESGRVLYGVLSVGGVLGIGDRLIAVPPGAFEARGNELRLDADKQKLLSTPEYSKDRDRASEMISPAFAGSAYQYFDQTAWWQATESMKPAGKFGNAQRASELVHRDVKNVSNQKIADVDSVMIDPSAGRVAYVILSPARDLNLGGKLLALPPNALTLAPDGKNLVTDLDRSKLASAPSFDRNTWADLSDPAYAARVYAFYGKQLYFDPATLQPTSSRTNSGKRIYHDSTSSEK